MTWSFQMSGTEHIDVNLSWSSPRTQWKRASLWTLTLVVGFRVYRHLMVDFLPYPHVLYACERLP